MNALSQEKPRLVTLQSESDALNISDELHEAVAFAYGLRLLIDRHIASLQQIKTRVDEMRVARQIEGGK